MNTRWISEIGCASLLTLALPAYAAHCCGGGHGANVADKQTDNPKPAATAAEQGHAEHGRHHARQAEAERSEHGQHGKEQAPEEPKALAAQTTCPVMKGGAIDRKLYFDHEGKRIYVCCAGCIAVVKADPAKAVATLAEQGQAPGQARCPIMPRTINPALHVDHEGQRIYACCRGCVRRIKANPEAALTKLREMGVEPEKIEEEPAAEMQNRDLRHHH